MTNLNQTKKALISSVLALVLCFSTLLGTTFAWFTDSVTSSGNIIQSGTLDVAMYWAEGTEDPTTATWEDASTTAIFNYDNWEPGYVDVKHVKISNVGTLALKYIVNIKANGEVSKLADVIDVYFVDPATQVSNRSDLIDTYKVGTLADVLNGEVAPARGDLIAEESDTITIALKMQESAGNEYQNLSIGTNFSVQVLATQLAEENDSFDNQYDADAVTYVAYDTAKTVAENATALQAALDAAEEGDIILLGAGNWYATKYKQFTINTDNITLVGENGAVLGFAEENRNSILDVHGDNVTIRNIEFNKNKQEFNQCILATGAENLTVDSCTFYGENYQGGNTPTLGIYIFEYLDGTFDEGNDEVTKFTITNNNFLGAAVGMYKGGANTVPNDPGVAAAQVSEDMVIENNTFVGANILIENWRSWSNECTRDHEFVPTIENNIFESPNLCFANTPHSIYLRCYRQGDPEKILPADYMDNFVANNTIATPENDTVVTYNGVDYVLNDNYGTFYRDNATYGIIAFCYGQSYAKGESVSSASELQAVIDRAIADANGDTTLIELTDDIVGDIDLDQIANVKIVIDGNDNDFSGVLLVDGQSSTYTSAGLTIQNINFVADSISADACIQLGNGTNATRYTRNVTISNCTFDVPGAVGIKSYTGGDKNLTITNCTATANAHSLAQLKGIDGVHIENCKVYSKNGINLNNSTNVTIIDCNVDVQGYAVRFGESSGGSGAAETYLIENCTLKSANDDGDATIILRGTADNSTLTIVNTNIVGNPAITNTATNATVIQ